MHQVLGEKKPELIKSASGKSLNDLTLQGVIDGKLDAKDFRITKETLELQAQVAESAGRGFFATNLRRAGELIPVPDSRAISPPTVSLLSTSNSLMPSAGLAFNSVLFVPLNEPLTASAAFLPEETETKKDSDKKAETSKGKKIGRAHV